MSLRHGTVRVKWEKGTTVVTTFDENEETFAWTSEATDPVLADHDKARELRRCWASLSFLTRFQLVRMLKAAMREDNNRSVRLVIDGNQLKILGNSLEGIQDFLELPLVKTAIAEGPAPALVF